MVGYLGHQWELYALWSWFLVFFTDVLEKDDEYSEETIRRMAAFATFFVIGVGTFGSFVGGVLGDSWGRTYTTAISMFISGLCALLVGLTRPWPALCFAVSLVWGFWVIADSSQVSLLSVCFC